MGLPSVHPDLRDVEDLLALCGGVGSNETIRDRVNRLGLRTAVKTASEKTGIDARRLRKALREEGLIGDGKPDGWETFDAAAARPVLDGLTTFVSAKAFAEQLSIPRSQFALLVADGALAPSLKDGDTYMAWDPRAGAAFLQSLLAGAEALSHAQHGWETIAKCAQRLKLRPAEIVRAIQAGQIHRVGNNIHFQGYQAIHVVHDDVAQVLGAGPAEEMTLDRFAKSVGIGRPVHLTRLVKQGHTPATRLRNPKTRAMQYYITQADADAFHEKFVSLRTLAKARKLSWQRASALLRLHNVDPFNADGMDFGNTFLKAEVEKALG